MWRAARKKNSEKTPQSCYGWWNMLGASCPGARRVETVGRHSKDTMARILHKNLYHSGRELLNRIRPRYNVGVWLGVRNNSAEWFVETEEGVFRAREVRRNRTARQVGP